MLFIPSPPPNVAGAKDASVYFPGSGELWYDIWSESVIKGAKRQTVAAPLESIPVYQRGGSIIPRKFRVRRSTKMMSSDPLTLIVALDGKGSAMGLLYMDDEHTLLHEKVGAFTARQFVFEANVLKNNLYGGSGGGKGGGYKNMVERIIVLGKSSKPAAVIATSGSGATRTLDFDYVAKEKTVIVRKPELRADEDWTVSMK